MHVKAILETLALRVLHCVLSMATTPSISCLRLPCFPAPATLRGCASMSATPPNLRPAWEPMPEHTSSARWSHLCSSVSLGQSSMQQNVVHDFVALRSSRLCSSASHGQSSMQQNVPRSWKHSPRCHHHHRASSSSDLSYSDEIRRKRTSRHRFA